MKKNDRSLVWVKVGYLCVVIDQMFTYELKVCFLRRKNKDSKQVEVNDQGLKLVKYMEL